MQYDYDLFVIGGGSGGVRAARVAAQGGARVAVAEADRYGGTCVIRGCVPKKLMVYASEFGRSCEDAAGFGWSVVPPTFDWPTFRAHKDEEIARLSRIYSGMLERAGATVHHARATLVDAHTLEVDGQRVTAETILIATGGRPFVPELPGADLVITSDDAFQLDTLPRRVTVVGGGYIAVEFAHIFRGLGCDVSLVHRSERVLRGFDEVIRDTVTSQLGIAGITTHLGCDVTAVARTEDGLAYTLDGDHTLETDLVMYATGRRPSTWNMGLEAAGVTLDGVGAVIVDEYSRSVVPNIYAIGDCTNRVNLTPVAIREGQAFVDTVFGDKPTPVDHATIPTAVFTQPPVGTVGLTEEAARAAHGDIDVYITTFRPLKHTMTGRQDRTTMKLIVDAASQRVLGAHMVGHDAAEIIQCVAIALRMGASKADFDATTAVHPTTAEEFVLMRTKR